MVLAKHRRKSRGDVRRIIRQSELQLVTLFLQGSNVGNHVVGGSSRHAGDGLHFAFTFCDDFLQIVVAHRLLKKTPEQLAKIRDYLAGIGVSYEHWEPAHPLPEGTAAAEVLAAYAPEIDRLKAEGSYVTADVIDVSSATPGLDAMLSQCFIDSSLIGT